MVGYTLREISDLFEGEGIAYSPVVPNLSGQRRSLVEQYYATVDWANPFDVNRVLRGRALPRAASVPLSSAP